MFILKTVQNWNTAELNTCSLKYNNNVKKSFLYLKHIHIPNRLGVHSPKTVLISLKSLDFCCSLL